MSQENRKKKQKQKDNLIVGIKLMEYERQKTERGTGNRRHERRKRIRQAGRQTDRQTEEKQ